MKNRKQFFTRLLLLGTWLGALLGMLLLPAVDARAQSAAWVRRYNSERGSSDLATKVITDADSNVIVVGSTDDNLTGRNMLIIKYSSAGVPLWTNRHSGNIASAVAADSSGNLFVTATSYEGFLTLAYSGAGVPLWTNRYNAPNSYARGVAINSSGNVIVMGSSHSMSQPLSEIVTIAYSGAGAPLWTNHYKGTGNNDGAPHAMAVDARGNVFVTGSSGYFWAEDGNISDFVTLAYSGAGVALWTNRYNGPANDADTATAVAVDSSGNVFVTGSSRSNGSDFDYATIKYSGAGVALWTNRHDLGQAMAADATGNVFVSGYSSGGMTTLAYSDMGLPLWTNRYAGSNILAAPRSLAVNSAGDVFVTGQAYSYGSRGELTDYQYVTVGYSGAGMPLWTNRCRGPSDLDDFASSIAIDSNDHVLVLVTGSSDSLASAPDFVTIAYSDAGVSLWTNHYDGPGHGYAAPVALAVDFGGNVIVTGYSYGTNDYQDCVTISYSDSGTPLWTNRFGGSAERPYYSPEGMKVDSNGNVFVTGTTAGDQWGCTTFALSRAGLPLWTNTYEGGVPRDIALDSNGNVFVVAVSSNSTIIKYSNAGLPLWTNLFDVGHSRGYLLAACAVDSDGNVFLTGTAFDVYGDYLTVAFSSAGIPLWTNRYDGTGNRDDFAKAIAVDSHGNVFVTGYSTDTGGYHDYATLAYSGAGVPLWTNHYSGYSNDKARAITVDSGGNVFVTGFSYSNEQDYATIAYSGTGIPLWTNRFEGPGEDDARAIAVDSLGHVVVTGYSENGWSYEDGRSYDYKTVAYSPTGTLLWTQTYNGPTDGRDAASRVATGPNGVVYVTGTSASGDSFDEEVPGSWEWVTIKYFPAPKLSIQPLSGSAQVNLTLTGAPDSSWSVERALEITGPWTNLGPVTLTSSGSASFQDANPRNPSAFYRIRQP